MVFAKPRLSDLLKVIVVGCALASLAVLSPHSNAVAAPANQADIQPASVEQPSEYRIGPLDKLDITVFELKDLTLTGVQVDANGQVLLPLIGLVDAKGKTARELSAEIARRLDQDYTQDSQVSVVVAESASQKVTVGGAVMEAGVFELHGHATLLQAIAMAKGVSRTANLKEVTVFRTTDDGRRQLLKFDANAIEKGRQPDPEVEGNDVVIVSESSAKNLFANATSVAPFLYLVTLFH
jgi:polysaccharide export outer membrane protein